MDFCWFSGILGVACFIACGGFRRLDLVLCRNRCSIPVSRLLSNPYSRIGWVGHQMISPTRLTPETGRRIRTLKYNTSTTTFHLRVKRAWWTVGLWIDFYWLLRFKLPAGVGLASVFAFSCSWKKTCGLISMGPTVPVFPTMQQQPRICPYRNLCSNPCFS